jgi:hypothetical protein
MNASTVAKHYNQLTAEERFRLIEAAAGRGDQAEVDRLVNTARRIALSFSEHMPFSRAVFEMKVYLFVGLLENAARYEDCVRRALAAGDSSEEASEDAPEAEGDDLPISARWLDLALYSGYLLKTEVAGWKLFCERHNIPPFATWEHFPGYGRLQRALTLAEEVAFVPEGSVRWLNEIRPPGAPEVQECDVTPDWYADQLEEHFREQVKWWGGKP